jgi:hypothetical protein
MKPKIKITVKRAGPSCEGCMFQEGSCYDTRQALQKAGMPSCGSGDGLIYVVKPPKTKPKQDAPYQRTGGGY